MKVLPFPIKNYLFEIFTRAGPGSSLVHQYIWPSIWPSIHCTQLALTGTFTGRAMVANPSQGYHLLVVQYPPPSEKEEVTTTNTWLAVVILLLNHIITNKCHNSIPTPPPLINSTTTTIVIRTTQPQHTNNKSTTIRYAQLTGFGVIKNYLGESKLLIYLGHRSLPPYFTQSTQ